MTIPSLHKPMQILLFFILLFVAAVYAKPFFVPFTMAALLAMLFLPWCQRMEQHMPRALAIIICLLCMIVVVAGVVALLSWQLSDLAANADEIEQNLSRKITELRRYIDRTFGISRQQQKELIKGGQPSGRLQTMVTGFLAGFGGFLTDLILVLVYLFLLLYYRTRLHRFVLMLVPQNKQQQAEKTLLESRKVAQKYLSGMALMIACLWVLYGIGFSIVGVKNAIFFAVLCGLLEIVPFIGNLTGTLFTVITVFAQGGSGGMVIGVLATYAVIQFVQTYLLEPLVVGAEVSINPLATIAGLVIGELVWGIPGMVLAIPLLGIVKIICDNVDEWKPVGYLLGSPPKKKRKNLLRRKSRVNAAAE
ncbi:AI-2E family transporter [Paracnuella aquatica]|uniref:AI-2E family transporter n=1 Tax=Paracnuella aquatica TaxID=2268757 RepID=UPI000DEF3E23|nr:AI-2E family transporter [Paracnuella aquatica]RPD45550.1 AI-2E family transporter [Paracnuella aquatica]